MKIAIIGCTHAGTAAVREILRQNHFVYWFVRDLATN